MSPPELLDLRRTQSHEAAFVPVDPHKLRRKPNTIREVLSQIILQIYRNALLRIPSLYFSRVGRVFEDAEVSGPEIKKLVKALDMNKDIRWPADHEWMEPTVSAALARFKESWGSFVKGVTKEWETLNVVNALLLTATLTVLQIPGASTTPAIRTTAFLSLFCALMSLVYGCVYILRFGTMKSMYKATIWAKEVDLEEQDTRILWNIWVLLAMPAVWIAWSLIFFCISMLYFVWNQPFSPSADDSASTVRSTSALAPRIIISFVFLLGVVYFVLVMHTFHQWRDRRGEEPVGDNEETGPPLSPDPAQRAPSSLRPSLESHFSRRNGLEMRDDEKMGTRQNRAERRAHLVDSAMV